MQPPQDLHARLIKDRWPNSALGDFFIAIELISPAQEQFHASMLYYIHDENNFLYKGELKFHLKARKNQISKERCSVWWITPFLEPEEKQMLAIKLDTWLNLNHDKIPYSVAHPGGITFRDNVWVGDPQEQGQGLTCSTFVVALFDELGIPFIDKDSWVQRPDDVQWFEFILGVLNEISKDERSGILLEDINAQKQRLGKTTRIRPIDVTAAAYLINTVAEAPLCFDTVDPVAIQIGKKIIEAKNE